MSDDNGDTEKDDDLAQAMQNLELPSEPLEAVVVATLQRLLTQDDLRLVSEDDINAVDVVQVRRGNYILALIRLGQLFRLQPTNFAERVHQAKLASVFVQQLERTGLASLQLGRSAKDDRLAEEVSHLRQQVNRLADYRAEAALRDRDRGQDQDSAGKAKTRKHKKS